MSKILLSKKNESLLIVSCDDSTAQELSEYFSFYAPGYQYQPMFKRGIWDGKIRLFDRRFSTIPYGLIPYIQKFVEDRRYEIFIDESLLLTTNFSLVEAEKFTKSLNLPHTPYTHQLEAFTKAMRSRRSVILSPTSSGKSLIIYMIVRFLEQSHKKGLIIVPTTSLVEQLYSDFIDYGWAVDKFVHRVYQGKEKQTKHFVTISTWQSMYVQSPEYLSQFDFVIGDEAHQFKAKSLSQLMNMLINADVRIGTTGTLDGTKVHKLVLEGLFGPVYKATSTKELMEKGHISNLKIKCLILKYPEEFCKANKKVSYNDEYQAVISNTSRMKFIRNLVLSLKGNTLILFKLVDGHGKILYQDIKDNCVDGRVFFIHGKVDTDDRENIRKTIEERTDSIVVASYGTFSTGINIKNLHNVIFAGPSKSRIRNLQSIGRGLRKSSTKECATLFDIVDDLRCGKDKRENFLLQHFTERAIIYNEEKFSFKQYYVELK